MGNSIYKINSSLPIRNALSVVQPMPGQIAYAGATGQGSGGYILSNAAREQDFTTIPGLEQQLDKHYLDKSYDRRVPASSADVAYGTNNADCTLLYPAAGPGICHELGGITWGYFNTPSGTASSIRIEDGSGNTVFMAPVTAGGAGFHTFAPRKRFTANTDLRVILSAGGAGVSGVVTGMEHMVV